LVGKGRIVSIDIESAAETLAHDVRTPAVMRPAHSRLEYWKGSSTSAEILERLKPLSDAAQVVMVILDSDHRKDHVLQELRLYHPFVTKGSYLIVEDTDINGHPVYPEFGPGPWEAVRDFLAGNEDFFIDEATNNNQILTLHPNGFLKRK
jgi:cephalosporin hydroxylase